jgi:hypothetical protein
MLHATHGSRPALLASLLSLSDVTGTGLHAARVAKAGPGKSASTLFTARPSRPAFHVQASSSSRRHALTGTRARSVRR